MVGDGYDVGLCSDKPNEAAMLWLVSVTMSGEAEFSPALKDA